MKITSPSFGEQGEIPREFSCDGEGVSPELNIIEAPIGAKSLALIVDDPDAPSGDFVHWVVWNISSTTAMIGRNEVPEGGVVGVNSSGSNKYIAPCPPSGTHHYHFKLYALDIVLDLESNAGKQELVEAMADHTIESAELVGLYSRQ